MAALVTVPASMYASWVTRVLNVSQACSASAVPGNAVPGVADAPVASAAPIFDDAPAMLLRPPPREDRESERAGGGDRADAWQVRSHLALVLPDLNMCRSTRHPIPL